MGKESLMNLKALKVPFEADEIEWRQQSQGVKNNNPWCMVLAYVSNRAIMNRLDSVCGMENWQNRFEHGANGGVISGISIKCGAEWVTKYDGADNTQVEAVKGGLSGAMKRAGVQWGIGRYLYYLDATFAECSLQKPTGLGWNKGYDKKTNTNYWWKTPILPNWALPIDKHNIFAIEEQIKATETDMDKFLNAFDVDNIKYLTMEQCSKALSQLQKKARNG